MKFRFAITLLALGLLSLTPQDVFNIELGYPGNDEAGIILTTNKFKTFEKEAKGSDYYIICQADDGMIGSVLFYKLNSDEVQKLVVQPAKKAGAKENSPTYPDAYFSTNSNTKEWETNEQKWGDPTGDFLFRQTDIKEIQGQKANQKNMFAYGMFGKDIFVCVHISKVNCTPADSIEMRQILATLKKKK